jgi:hypothetical protein
MIMVQRFDEFIVDFIRMHDAKDVIEIGSDAQLRLASRIAPHCRTLYSVNLPEDCEYMRGWYELLSGMGCSNIKMIGGNATNLSSLVSHADVIILQNVLLDMTGTDTELIWKYEREELPHTQADLDALADRFDQAAELAYKEFLKVAKPGQIVKFSRPNPNFIQAVKEKLDFDPAKVSKLGLLYDDADDVWEAYIIDNR